MRARFQNLEPDRQERLINCAIAEFCDQGFEGGSLNRILKNADMSKSSFYYYFEDKLDIFSEVGRRAASELSGQIGELSLDQLTGESFWPTIETFLLSAMNATAQEHSNVRIARLFYHLRDNGNPDGKASPLYIQIQAWVHALVVRGCELGRVRKDLPASLLTSTCMGIAEAIDRWMTEFGSELPETERNSLLLSEVSLFQRIASR